MTEPITQPESQHSALEESELGSPRSNQELLRDKTIQPKGRSLAEWITFAIASIILLALIVLIIYDWQVNQLRPPTFSVTLNQTPRIDHEQYYVPFEIQNTGGRIARTVQVTATLHIDGKEDESGDQQIDFLSGNERKQGSFVFTHDPQQGKLSIRVASYRSP